MDDTDLTISLILSGNSRMAYQELAGILKLSVNAVHKRVKNLVKSGIIRKFVTKLNLPFSNVLIYGSCSRTNDMEKAYIKLGEHESIYNVTICSDNYLIIHAYLEKIQDLDSLVSFVRKTAKMTEPTIGLHSVNNSEMTHDFFYVKSPDEDEYFTETSSSMDYLIVDSLKDNSRKTITEISNEIGVSSKTVRRRLNRLIEKNLIFCTLEFFPDKTGDITANLILKIKPEAVDAKEKIVEKLKEEFGIKIVFHWAFSNLPNEMIVLIFTHSMRELQEIEKFISKLSDTIESSRIIIGYKGDIFDCLRESYLSKKIKEIREKSK